MLKLIKKHHITPQDIINMFIRSQPFMTPDISGQSYASFEDKLTNWTIVVSNWNNGQLEGTYEYCQNEYDGNCLVYCSPTEIKKWKVDFSTNPVLIFPNSWTIEELITQKKTNFNL